MAQYVTLDQAHNFEINGKTYDLIGMIEELDLAPGGWISPARVDELTVGQTAHVWARGKSRLGVVSKVAQHRATVTFMIPSEAEEALRSPGEAVALVMDTAVHVDQIQIPAPTVEDEKPHGDIEAEEVQAGNVTGSTVVQLLERVWDRIRREHPDLPEVVIITGSGLVGASKWGHFRAEGWRLREEGAVLRRHELFLAGEALAKGARQVLQTMLHEGAHTLARVRDLKDTSRQGRWHNKTFRRLSEEMGLEHRASKADTVHGYSFVTLAPGTEERYADLLADLDEGIRLECDLPVWMGGRWRDTSDGAEGDSGSEPESEPEGGDHIRRVAGTGDSPRKSGNVKAVCGCDEPLIIRLSRKVLDTRAVCCEMCGCRFKQAD